MLAQLRPTRQPAVSVRGCVRERVVPLRSFPLPPSCKSRPRAFCRSAAPQSAASASPLTTDAVDDAVTAFERLTLLRREQQLAVDEENYKRAAELRDLYSAVLNALPERQQAVAVTVSRLTGGTRVERINAAKLLGDIGDTTCIPAMSFALTDSDAEVHKSVEEAMWKLFMKSGSAEVDAKLQTGMQAMLMYPTGLDRARDIFTQVVEMAPDYAEGYNKRATVHYLMKDFRGSIADCEKVVELQPLHFGALSGAGLCFVGLQDYPNALSWFKRALAVNPGMAQIRHYDKILRSALAVQEEAKAKAEALRLSRKDDEPPNSDAPAAVPPPSIK